ncbi:MAG: hypothetical protein GF329_05900 [Candidatus Lokiarchaeota archaeon]|nr:hypothetical protein [Candidatus Lokiarchaeota archaeon]
MKVLEIRKKVKKSFNNFSINIPIYCCGCFKKIVNSLDLNQSDRVSDDYNMVSPTISRLRDQMLRELRRLMNL